MSKDSFTLTEALKKLRLINKKLRRKSEEITLYSSALEIDKPAFGTDEAQRKEVKSRIQASEDLIKEYLDLKRRIDLTNATTIISVSGNEMTISELLTIKREIGRKALTVYNSLSEDNAKKSMAFRHIEDDKDNRIKRFYDEKMKNDMLKEWYDIIDEIDLKLETINSTTELKD